MADSFIQDAPFRDTDHRLIAILRGITPAETETVVSILLETGFTAIEVPLNSPNAFESIAIASSLVKRHLGADGLVGAGTVLTPEDVALVHAAGGNVIISPDCYEPVIQAAMQAKMTCFPGVFTASEAHQALRLGAHGLKLFPASVLGLAGVKALSAILPSGTPLYAVGGVDGDDFARYHKAGCYGFGIGSALYQPQMLQSDLRQKAGALAAKCHQLFYASS